LKILILKPSSLGDVVQALPVLRLLKHHLPASEIFWWIDSKLAPLLEGDPDLTGVVRFERRRWTSPLHWPEALCSIRWLRAQNFDWVIDLQCLARSGAFAWLANGQFLIGLDEPREGARGFYDVAVRRASFHTHAVDWYLAVLPRLGVPVHTNFQWLPERPEIAVTVKSKWQTDGARWIALQPGARWPNKRWPVEYFAKLVQLLAEKFPDTRFAILGDGKDKSLGEIISHAAPERCLNLCGQTSLPEMVEWLRLCNLMVTNDTGPMHVAAALGTPVVVPFGSTSPELTGPGLPGDQRHHRLLKSDAPCSPCFLRECPIDFRCMNGITVERVVEAVLEFKL
jgi:heptosyltransferase-1/heptosyltransferase-2